MGFRREVKIRFMIMMVIAVVLVRCWSNGMSRQDSEEEYGRHQPGTCSTKPVWVLEHISKSPMEQWTNIPLQLTTGRDARDLTFRVNGLLKYVFLDGQDTIVKNEQLYNVPVHQVSRGQQDAYLHWTNSPVDDDFCSRLGVLILGLFLLHSSALAAMIHQLTSHARKVKHKSEESNKANAKMLRYFSTRSHFDIAYAVKNWHSKDRKKQSWMEDPLPWAGHFIECTTYSVLERVASYRPFAFIRTSNAPPAVTLAAAGFRYPGAGSAVQCQGCRSSVDISSFNSPATEAKYHRDGCSFVTASSHERTNDECHDTEEGATGLSPSGEDERAAVNASSTTEFVPSKFNATSNTPLGTLPPASMANDQLNNQVNVETLKNYSEIAANQSPQLVSVTGNEHEFAEPLEPHSQQTAPARNTTIQQTATWECEQISQVPVGTRQQTNEAVARDHEQISQVPVGTRQQTNEAVTRDHEQISQVPVGTRQQTNQAVARDHEQKGQVPAVQQLQASASSETTGACANPDNSETDSERATAIMNLLLDPRAFDPEAQPVDPECLDPREACQKNPGHFGNYPLSRLQVQDIPSNVRCPEMLEFFQLIGKLVVKLTIKKTSSNRPQFGGHNETHPQCGTGLAFVETDSDDPAPSEPTRRWNTIKRFIPGFKKNKCIIYIKTSRHVIFDDFEAQNTLVEFFYDNPNSKEIVKAKGVSVAHSLSVGDATSVLKCTILDPSMVEFVKNTENQIQSLVARLPQRIKEGLTKRVFVISHPHGLEKAFSYGEYAIVKYALKTEKRNGQYQPEIVKINNHSQISENSHTIRKLLFYTADTCKGSSGGLVVSFKKTNRNGTEDIQLDPWIHSCVEKKHGLNASVMKELTEDDITNHGITSINRPSVQDEQEAEADAAARQIVPGPVYTVMDPPAHPVYAPYMKRLGSYPSPFSHVHTAADLADAGFFFAGYADCVRCFQCGLGLRSWKPGDSIYTEHHKNRPDCQFLQMKMRANGFNRQGFQPDRQHRNSRTSVHSHSISQMESTHQQQHQLSLATTESSRETNETQVLKPSSGLMSTNQQQEPVSVVTPAGCSNDEDSSDVPKSTAVSVLEREQKYLKQLFTCKICFEEPVKDLFLPCGELVACLGCSKLLTHCPSCNKKILATVTTYFS